MLLGRWWRLCPRIFSDDAVGVFRLKEYIYKEDLWLPVLGGYIFSSYALGLEALIYPSDKEEALSPSLDRTSAGEEVIGKRGPSRPKAQFVTCIRHMYMCTTLSICCWRSFSPKSTHPNSTACDPHAVNMLYIGDGGQLSCSKLLGKDKMSNVCQ